MSFEDRFIARLDRARANGRPMRHGASFAGRCGSLMTRPEDIEDYTMTPDRTAAHAPRLHQQKPVSKGPLLLCSRPHIRTKERGSKRRLLATAK